MRPGPMGPIGQKQQQVKINPDDCPQMFCPFCENESFITITRFKAVSVLLMPPSGGHLTLQTTHCTKCHEELDLELAKKWATLTPEKRKEAREAKIKAYKEKIAKGVGVGFKATKGVGFKKG